MSMSVTEAVAAHRSIRAFLDRPVATDQVATILRQAARAPSGGNVQPWSVIMIEGPRLAALKRLMRRRCAESPDGEAMHYNYYPDELPPVHKERRARSADIMYDALAIDPTDTVARQAWIYENFQFFGAPLGLFFLVHRQFAAPQWLDLGFYLQTVTLLLREAGLDSCCQANWSMFEASVLNFLQAPAGLTLICGMAVGYGDPDAAINRIVVERDDPILHIPSDPETDS